VIFSMVYVPVSEADLCKVIEYCEKILYSDSIVLVCGLKKSLEER